MSDARSAASATATSAPSEGVFSEADIAAMRDIVVPFLSAGQSFDIAMPLIGPERSFESMTLVELCLAMEDLGLEQGFDFDWTSEHAMSRSASIFKTLASLLQEFVRQRNQAQAAGA